MSDPLTEPAGPPRADSTSPPADATADTPAPRLAGGYEIGPEIARGGMGVVHRGRDLALNREVAIKLLQDKFPADGPDAHRFVEEARITGQLQHPGIPAVHHVGTLPDGRPFLAMKLIEGRTLHELLTERGPGTPNLFSAFEGICQAVGYAHSRGVIHRDLKPANVMVGSFGEVLVMDWGLAKTLATRERERPEDAALRGPVGVTRAGSVIGTPAFIPPEQANGVIDQIDARSDVFGLGAILCVILTGRPPYDGGSSGSIRSKAAAAAISWALTTCEADSDYVALCQRCLSADKADRLPDGNAVARRVAELRAAADDRAKRDALAKAASEARWRTLERAVTAVAAVLMIGVAGTLYGFVQARQAAGREKARADGEAVAKGEAQRATVDALAQRDAAEKARDRAATAAAAEAVAKAAARDALDAMTSSLTGDVLTAQKGITPVQRKFLAEVRGYYRMFAADTGQDELAQARTAAAAFRVGKIEEKIGRREDALAAYIQARDGYSRLAADRPTVPAYRAELARSLMNAGNQLADLGRGPDAESAYRAGLGEWDRLAADHPGVAEYRWSRARSYCSIGQLVGELNRPDDAERAFATGLAQLEALVEANPRAADFARDLGLYRTNLGNLLAAIGRADAAEQVYRAAIPVFARLAADHPTVPTYRELLATASSNLGLLLTRAVRLDQAESQLTDALAHWERLVVDHPAVPDYRLGFGGNACNFGQWLFYAGRVSDSAEWHGKAIRALTPVHEQEPQAVQPRTFLRNAHLNRAIAFDHLNRPADALADWDRALALDDGTKGEFIRHHRAICRGVLAARPEPAPPPRAVR